MVDKGWDAPFVGDAAEALWDHICHFYTLSNEQAPALATDMANSMAPSYVPPNHVQREYYAQYCTILQSSGIGKSCTVDEISKTHFVIPVVLRRLDTTGFVFVSLS